VEIFWLLCTKDPVVLKKIEIHIYKIHKKSEYIFLKRAKIKFNTFVFSATQKGQTCGSDYLSMYIFKSPNLSDFVIFVYHNTKNFAWRFGMLVGYIIDYVQICSQLFFETYKYDF
jgi:hypothetical protein